MDLRTERTICTIRGKECGRYEMQRCVLGEIKTAVNFFKGALFAERREREGERQRALLGTLKKNTSPKPSTGELRGTDS